MLYNLMGGIFHDMRSGNLGNKYVENGNFGCQYNYVRRVNVGINKCVKLKPRGTDITPLSNLQLIYSIRFS